MPIPRHRTRKGTAALRKGRFSAPNQIYHISTATIERLPVFESLQFGRILVQAMKREDDAGHTLTLAFVIMPDHLHWLFMLIGSRSMEICVNTVKSYSTRRINQANQCKGPLWQKGFFDRAVRSDEDLVTVARYIVANPLRGGLVKTIRQYSLWDARWI